MSLILITKTNSTAITPYMDSVQSYTATGTHGFYAGVGREGTYSTSDKSGIFTIYNGMGVIYGRRFELNEFEEINFSSFNATTYATIYFELDCSDSTNETISLKYITSGTGYPAVEGDDLISTANGVARIPCYYVEYDGANDVFVKVTRKMPVMKPFDSEGFQNIQAYSGVKAISMKGALSSNTYEYVERKTPVIFNESKSYNVNAPTFDIDRFVKLTDVTTLVGGRAKLNHTISGFSLKPGYKYEVIYWNPPRVYDSGSTKKNSPISQYDAYYYTIKSMILYCVQENILLDATKTNYNYITSYGDNYVAPNNDGSDWAFVKLNNILLYSIPNQTGVYVNVDRSDLAMSIIINEIEGGSC